MAFEREQWWPSEDLFRLDAGEQEVGIQFRAKTQRTDHVETPEARERARGGYVFTPRYDYHATDVLRLLLYHGGHNVASWEDTVRMSIECRLVPVLDRIERSTKDVIAHREAERWRWEEERRRREQEQHEHHRVVRYDAWVDGLVALCRRTREHAELATFVAALRQRIGEIDDAQERARLGTFLDWAQAHLNASDPFTRLDLPTGDRPDMTYAEWNTWKIYFEDQQRRGVLPWHLR